MRERKIPTKKINTPGGMLSRLKDKLLVALGVDASRLALCIERYAVKNNGGVRNSDSHSARTNMLKAIQRGELTIFIFFRILQALEIVNIKFTITVTTKDGKEYTVSESTSRNNTIKKEDNNENL